MNCHDCGKKVPSLISILIKYKPIKRTLANNHIEDLPLKKSFYVDMCYDCVKALHAEVLQWEAK